MMKIKYIILLLVPAILLAQGSFRRQKIDRLAVSTESQITMEDTVRMDTLTADSVPYANSSNDLVSSTISQSELEQLEGISVNVQNELDLKLYKALPQNYIFVGQSDGNASGVSMSGEASILDTGALTLDNDSVIGKLLTGFTSGAGAITASDSILSSIQKLDGNVATKEPLLTKGDLTEATSSVLTILGGTNSVIGTGTSIQVQQATTLTDGYLSLVDWNIFNGKQDTISGTANEIDFVSNTVGIADNPIIPGNASITIPAGATGDRPTGVVGMLRYNTDLSAFEGFDGGWNPIAGGGGGGGLDMWTTSTSYVVDDIVWSGNLIYKALSAHTSGATFEADYALGYWQSMVDAIPLLGKGSLLSSDGLDNGEFSACADGETIVWDASETNGFKCSPLATEAITNWESVSSPSSTWSAQATEVYKYRRVGDTMEVMGIITLTAEPTTANLQITIPNGKSIDTSKLPDVVANYNFGLATFRDASNSARTHTSLNASDVGGQNAIRVRYADSTSMYVSWGNFIMTNGTADSGDVIEFRFSVPILGWSSNNSVAAFDCDNLECVNEFSAAVSSADVVSNESTDWINGNCTNATAGRATCTFQTSLFSVAPNCQVTGDQGNDLATIDSVSASSVIVRTQAANTTTDTDLGFKIHCQRAGSDYNQYNQRFVKVNNDKAEWAFAGFQANFWDATGSTDDFDISLVSNNNNDLFEIVDEGGQTRIKAKKDIIIDVTFSSSSNAGVGNKLQHSSSVGQLSFSQVNTSAGVFSTSGSARLIVGEYIYMQMDGSSDRQGGVSITARPTQTSAFITGDIAELTETVKSTGATNPVMYSAHLTASTGAVSREVGNFINGSTCTYATGIYTCDISDANFSSTPNCWGIADDSNESFVTQITAVSSTSVTIRIRDNGGSFALVNRNVNLFCHGVK